MLIGSVTSNMEAGVSASVGLYCMLAVGTLSRDMVS